MSWDPCSFQISGKVCTLQWLKISDIDSSTPEVVSFQQCLTKEQKNARTHFWLDTPRMVLCCDANMFSQALEDQHGQLYIRESLSNIEQLDDWWKGNFVRSGRTSARGVPSFLFHDVPRFHTRIAPICASKPAKIIPRSKNIKNLMQLVIEWYWMCMNRTFPASVAFRGKLARQGAKWFYMICQAWCSDCREFKSREIQIRTGWL